MSIIALKKNSPLPGNLARLLAQLVAGAVLIEVQALSALFMLAFSIAETQSSPEALEGLVVPTASRKAARL